MPRPRLHLIRFHGVLAPNAKLRALVVPNGPEQATDYAPVGDAKALVPALSTLHKDRVRRDKDFQNLQENIAQAQELRKSNVISLNEVVRRKERVMQEKRLAAMQGTTGAMADDGLQANERNLGKSLAAEKTQDAAKDVLLTEAVSILADALALKQGKAPVATNALPTGAVPVMELPVLTPIQ